MIERPIVTIVTAADTHDLTTLATAKDELNILDSAQDDRIRRWIHEISGFIETYCNRTFASETVSELWRTPGNGVDMDRLRLTRFPVSAVTSITEDADAALTTSDYETDADAGWIYRMTGASGTRTRWYAQKIVVVYTAGYATLTDLPWQIETACLTLLQHRNAARGRGDPYLQQIDVPGLLTRRWWIPSGDAAGLPPEVIDLLAPFREVNV